MFDFLEDNPFFVVIVVLVGVLALSVWVYNAEDKVLRECFFQEPRTAECEYRLWKYGARKNTSVNTATYVPVKR